MDPKFEPVMSGQPTPPRNRVFDGTVLPAVAQNNVLRNTYWLLALSMLPTVAGAFFGAQLNLFAQFAAHPIATPLLMFGAMLGMLFVVTRLRNSAWGIVALFGFTFVAGLMLMAGKETPAAEISAQANAGVETSIAPESLERLGWWYYRAGRYPAAETLLLSLAAQRPGDAGLQHDLAWIELEQNKFDEAIRRFRIPNITQQSDSPEWNTPAMGLAIALWKSHHAEDAINAYEPAIIAEPRCPLRLALTSGCAGKRCSLHDVCRRDGELQWCPATQ
jgi:tetratricopeptide (TPR) repeat protein